MSTASDVGERILELTQQVIANSVMNNERIAGELGIHLVDLQALGIIARSGAPMSAGELSARTALPTSTTTRVLDRLERRGFVERRTDPADRRRVVVHARLEALAASSPTGDPWAAVSQRVREIHESFTADELRVVERYLERLREI